MKEFVVPAINRFGAGSIQDICELAKLKGLKKALVVTDGNLVKCGIAARLEQVLTAGGIPYVLFADVQPNPTKQNVNDALAAYHAGACDFIVGLGGGSPNDCAKGCSILATNGGKLEDYEGGNRSKLPGAPIIAVNTTAGTASEISRAYLISDEEKKEKIICKDINALPVASINDPELMVGLPAGVTAATGMDALVHAVESYVCNNSYLLTREMAVSACRLVFTGLREVLATPTSIELREQMIYAQSLAGMAFCNSGVGIAHSLAHALGATYHLGHGLCCAIMLPGVIRYNLRGARARYSELGRALFPARCAVQDDETCAGIFLEEVERLSEDVGTKVPLAQLGVKEADLHEVAEKALRDGNTGRNPIAPTLEDLVDILRQTI